MAYFVSTSVKYMFQGAPPIWSWERGILHREPKKEVNIKASWLLLLGAPPGCSCSVSSRSAPTVHYTALQFIVRLKHKNGQFSLNSEDCNSEGPYDTGLSVFLLYCNCDVFISLRASISSYLPTSHLLKDMSHIPLSICPVPTFTDKVKYTSMKEKKQQC